MLQELTSSIQPYQLEALKAVVRFNIKMMIFLFKMTIVC